MVDDDPLIEKARKKVRHLSEWLQRYKKADEVAGEVQDELEVARWQLKALEDRPDEASDIQIVGLGKTLDSDIETWETALPLMPEYEKSQIIQASRFSSSGTVSIYQHASQVRDIGTQGAIEYSDSVTVAFEGLHKDQKRQSKLEGMIGELGSPNLSDRFSEASKACKRFLAGAGSREAAAIHMRNLIDGLKGELFEIARNQEGEKMTWDLMAERISVGGPGSKEYEELIGLDGNRQSLVERLSLMAKDREGGVVTDVKNVWTTLQTFILSVLGLVDI